MKVVSIEIVCPFCGQVHYVDVLESEWNCYCLGSTAQQAFPRLSKTEREQIISHICPECQDDIFGM